MEESIEKSNPFLSLPLPFSLLIEAVSFLVATRPLGLAQPWNSTRNSTGLTWSHWGQKKKRPVGLKKAVEP